MPLIQNFSVAAGDEMIVNIDVDPDEGFTLLNCEIFWNVYQQEHGVPKLDVDPIIEKTLHDGIDVTNPTASQFAVTLTESDTISLLRNYYHEVTIIDGDGNRTTPTVGIMTVTQTENRF